MTLKLKYDKQQLLNPSQLAYKVSKDILQLCYEL